MITFTIIVTLIFMLLAGGLLLALRLWDFYQDRREWRRLLATQPISPLNYDASMVADLPEPVRRFFNYVIMPGTRLKTVADIKMAGEFGLGNYAKPNYRTMVARQVLAAPIGFVWQVNMPGVVSVSGSDSESWTRFRIFGLIPVARIGGSADHAKSAFGRYVAEAVFWSPAALLPGPGIRWEAVSKETARVTVTHKSLSQSVDITLDAKGCPGIIRFMRWSDANPEKKHRLQPFGGRLSDFRAIDGFRVPFYVEGGNMFGTEDEFIFFKATVNSINFPDPPEKACE